MAIGLELSLEMGVDYLEIRGDSRFLLRQMVGDEIPFDPRLIPYFIRIQRSDSWSFQ